MASNIRQFRCISHTRNIIINNNPINHLIIDIFISCIKCWGPELQLILKTMKKLPVFIMNLTLWYGVKWNTSDIKALYELDGFWRFFEKISRMHWWHLNQFLDKSFREEYPLTWSWNHGMGLNFMPKTKGSNPKNSNLFESNRHWRGWRGRLRRRKGIQNSTLLEGLVALAFSRFLKNLRGTLWVCVKRLREKSPASRDKCWNAHTES